MKIYGAGLAGLLAACVWQHAPIFEASTQPAVHKALLRFRSKAVSDLTGIPFRQVRVHKGVWYQGEYHAPNIRFANWYALKVSQVVKDRSIWNIESVDRYIAPENFIEQLLHRHAARIQWGHILSHLHHEVGPAISTIPMSVMAVMMDPNHRQTFTYAPIVVKRWRVPDADVYQTVYFPDPSTSLYRVSITKDLVVAEYMHTSDDYNFWPAFGLTDDMVIPHDRSSQRFGKIATLEDETWRKQFIYELSQRWKIYSVGRFATWRNILLDDVVNDLHVVSRLINASPYERLKEAHR